MTGPILLARCDDFETFGVAPKAFADAGAETVIWQAVDDVPAPPLDGVAGVVIFGSSSNVEHADERPFINRIRDVTLEAIDRRIPYLGVCFGAQTLAWSLGAGVRKAPAREVGFVPIRPEPASTDDPLLSHYTNDDHVFQWHMDTFDLPEGAELLVAGEDVRHQAYRLGDRTWGVQYHFEIDEAEMRLWLDAFSEMGDLLTDWGKSTDEVLAEADRHLAAHTEKGAEVFRRFAAFAAANA